MPVSVPPRPSRRGSLGLALFALLGLVIPAGVFASKPPPPPPVDIQLLNISDWHGNLDPVSNAAGGAWNISARWQQDRLAFPTLTLTAGDDFGASPPLSGFFNEEPAVKAQRLMGIQVNTFGNHNFDKGVAHLQEMINLAGAPSTGTGGDFPGEPFSYVAANLENLEANLTGVEPFEMFDVGGAKVAVIGIVNEDAPTLVSPGAFGTMVVTDGVAATVEWATKARKAGANAVIVITHKGMNSVSPTPEGVLLDFASALPAGLVDVVIGDHTNVQYSGTAPNGVLFHENLSFGNTYAKTLLNVQPKKGGTVNSKSVSFVTPGPTGTLGSNGNSCTGGSPVPAFCDQAILDMLAPYRADLAAALDGVIGTTTLPFDRGGNIERRQEVPLGDLIADGMRITYGTQIAFFTGGGIRSQFPACGYSPTDHTLDRANWNLAHTTVSACAGYGGTAPYDLVVGDVYSVITFGNNILTRDVTGSQLWQALENGVSKCPSGGVIDNSWTCQGRFPQISGFKFTFDYSRPTGCSGNELASLGPITWACVTDPATYRVTAVTWPDGTPIPADGTVISMAVVDFTNTGGDSYFMLADGQGVTRDRDANVMLDYVESIGPNLDPATMFPGGRITRCPCP